MSLRHRFAARFRFPLPGSLALLALLAAPHVTLAWDDGGTPVATAVGEQQLTDCIPDGEGGTYVAWVDLRAGIGGSSGLYVLRLAPNGGTSPGWSVGGELVSAHTDGTPRLCSDGAGGVFVAFTPSTSGGFFRDVWVTHLLGDAGLAPGVPWGGRAICDTTGDQDALMCAPDGSGGAFVVWRDPRDYGMTSYDLYAHHVTSDCRSTAGWPKQGAPVARSIEAENPHALLADVSGGAWVEFEAGPSPGHASLQHLGPDGLPVGSFPADGLPLAPGAEDSQAAGVFPTTHGDVLAICHATTNSPGYYASRFSSDTTRAPGWPAGGRRLPIAGGTAFAPAEDGGVVTAWLDRLQVVRAGRVDAEGALPFGWSANGVPLSASTAPAAVPQLTAVTSNGANGVFVAWSLYSPLPNPPPGVGDIYLSHVLADGTLAPGWPTQGLDVTPTPAYETVPRLVPAPDLGVVVVFERGSLDSTDILASRVAGGDVVPVQVSLVAAHWNGVAIDVEWFLGEPPARVEVERDDGSGWSRVATLAPDGQGHVSWTDAAVVAGRRYAYRLSWNERGATLTGGETVVDVPAQALSMAARCAPGADRAVFRLVLAPGLPARLTLHDVQGRRVAHVDVAAGEPTRELALPTGALAAGVYLARFEQGPAGVHAKVVVTR